LGCVEKAVDSLKVLEKGIVKKFMKASTGNSPIGVVIFNLSQHRIQCANLFKPNVAHRRIEHWEYYFKKYEIVPDDIDSRYT